MMIKPNIKSKISSEIDEIRRKKAEILKEMQKLEEAKKIKAAQKIAKEKPPIKINTETPILKEVKIKKLPHFQAKSFAEVMKEATEKERLKKRLASENPIISAKKRKIDDESAEISKIPLKSINSNKKSNISVQPSKHHQENKSKPQNNIKIYKNPINKEKIHQKSLTSSKNALKSDNLPNNRPKTSNSVDFPSKSVFRTPIASEKQRGGIISQNSLKKTEKIPLKSTQNNGITNQNRGILAQSGSNINRLNKPVATKRPSSTNDIQEINKRSNQVKSDKNNKINREKNHNVAEKNKFDKNTVKKTGIMAQNNGNRLNNQRNVGIISQNNQGVASRGILAQNSRGIAAQNSRGIAAQNSRGIAAQNSRGIAAQNSRGGVPIHSRYSQSASVYSQSASDSEYDSQLEDFIDDSERHIDDDIRKSIYESLRYEPDKYVKVSSLDNCGDMVSSSKQIQQEEARSIRIAKEEDMREAKLEEARLKKKGKL